MSKLKISSNLFLEQTELQKLKTFLDDQGFRKTLLQNSAAFGFVKFPNAAFGNGLVTDGGSGQINIAALSAIDSNGQFVTSPAITGLQIPNDNNYYWLKVSYQTTNIEVGTTYSIDTLGNLVCTSGNGSFTSLLRGQPNYPSWIQFPNSTYNTLKYYVEEVIDDNHATLTGSFTSESSLTLSVLGTFTPGYAPLTSEMNIFQYDSALFTLVQSNTSTPPSYTLGSTLEFFVARVRYDGTTLSIEDKRTAIWTPTEGWDLLNHASATNAIIGIDQITYDDQCTPRSENVVQVSWGFRATTFTVNLKLNQITISAGSGGILKTPAGFGSTVPTSSFNGWRLYTNDGNYFTVQSALASGGNIQLNFDHLEANSFFSDLYSTAQIAQTLALVPNAEEIEIIATAEADVSNPAGTDEIVSVWKTFPINELFGRLKLTVYSPTAATYLISYRYKNFLSYSGTNVIPNDAQGYYNENQFNIDGYLNVTPTRTSYSNGLITLIQSSGAYINFKNKVDVGDIYGVNNRTIGAGSIPAITLVVGQDKQYQHFTGSSYTLSADVTINLSSVDVNGSSLRDGASFFLHFQQPLVLNGHNFQIAYNYPGSPVILRAFNINDTTYINANASGLFMTATWSTSLGGWILSSMPVIIPTYRNAIAGNGASVTNTPSTVLTWTVPSGMTLNNCILSYNVTGAQTGAGSGAPSLAVQLEKNGTTIAEGSYTQDVSAYSGNIAFQALTNLVAGDVVTVVAVTSTGTIGLIFGNVLIVDGAVSYQ